MYVPFVCINCVINLIFSEEDVHNSYGKLVLKYYAAEGVVNKHEIFLASAECKPETVLQVCLTSMFFGVIFNT